MTDEAVRPKMRAHMPLAEREALRAAILEDVLAEARREASEIHLTVRCLLHQPHRAPGLSEAQRRAQHVQCNGESAGNGCLCTWHDGEQDEDGAVPPAQVQ